METETLCVATSLWWNQAWRKRWFKVQVGRTSSSKGVVVVAVMGMPAATITPFTGFNGFVRCAQTTAHYTASPSQKLWWATRPRRATTDYYSRGDCLTRTTGEKGQHETCWPFRFAGRRTASTLLSHTAHFSVTLPGTIIFIIGVTTQRSRELI